MARSNAEELQQSTGVASRASAVLCVCASLRARRRRHRASPTLDLPLVGFGRGPAPSPQCQEINLFFDHLHPVLHERWAACFCVRDDLSLRTTPKNTSEAFRLWKTRGGPSEGIISEQELRKLTTNTSRKSVSHCEPLPGLTSNTACRNNTRYSTRDNEAFPFECRCEFEGRFCTRE